MIWGARPRLLVERFPLYSLQSEIKRRSKLAGWTEIGLYTLSWSARSSIGGDSLRLWRSRMGIIGAMAGFVKVLQIECIIPYLIDCCAVKAVSPTLNSTTKTIGPIRSTASIRRPMRGMLNSMRSEPAKPTSLASQQLDLFQPGIPLRRKNAKLANSLPAVPLCYSESIPRNSAMDELYQALDECSEM